MKVAFISNYMNVHQLPFCEAMKEIVGEDEFKFIATTPFNVKRLTSGYQDLNQKDFVMRSYELSEQSSIERYILDSDVVLTIPHPKPDFVSERLRKREGITFVVTERLLKNGLWYRYFPPKAIQVWNDFVRYRGRADFNVLCASAFTSYDLSLFGYAPEHCWKWGYYPKIPDTLLPRKCGRASIVWAARLIKWKRPYGPLQLSKKLLDSGYEFHLTMIGEGEMRSELERFVTDNGLSEVVTFTGAIPNSEVHRIMSSSDIFLFTSNRAEGWGAVLNEAMANGCAPVVASQIGSVPYLIQDGINGMVFDGCNLESAFECLKYLLDNREIAESMGNKARESLLANWSPNVAASRLVELSNGLLSDNPPQFESGPCSSASVIPDNWWGGSRV